MPFTTKEQADYIEMINDELDAILITELDDFERIADALEELIPPSILTRLIQFFFPSPPTVQTPLPESVISIKEYLDRPQDYVRSPQDYSEYKGLIIGRIQAKILELRSLNIYEKLTSILNKQKCPQAGSYEQFLRPKILAPRQYLTEYKNNLDGDESPANPNYRFLFNPGIILFKDSDEEPGDNLTGAENPDWKTNYLH